MDASGTGVPNVATRFPRNALVIDSLLTVFRTDFMGILASEHRVKSRRSHIRFLESLSCVVGIKRLQHRAHFHESQPLMLTSYQSPRDSVTIYPLSPNKTFNPLVPTWASDPRYSHDI